MVTQMSSFEKARQWRKLSVFNGRLLKKRWGHKKIRNKIHEPLFERTPCDKCTDSNDAACRSNYWVVKNLLELTRLVGALQHQNPRQLLWFRGEYTMHEKATPKACRSIKDWRDFLNMTEWFNNNAGEGRLFNNRDELAKWAILQHYGVPTPLLDVTTSLRIAIFNALEKPKSNNEGKKKEEKVSQNISVFATPRPLDGMNIFTEAGLCLIDLVAELPSNCLRPHVQRAGFLGLTDIVIAGLGRRDKKPSVDEASLDCVRIAKICIKNKNPKVVFDMPDSKHVFPPASYIFDCKKDDMSGDYLLGSLHALKESCKPCPLKNFPNHYRI